jgi:FkbM family methyltransferase
MATLSAHRVNLVFDVGANCGQFGLSLREIGYTGRIVSFEPLTSAWNQLVRTSKDDPLWEIAPRGAIGSEDGEIEMHVAANSVSSSALPMLDSHVQAAPGSSYVGTERSPLCRLDSIASNYLRPDSSLFIKIDAQGFEPEVLKGASELLKQTVGVQLELSLVPLYEGESLYTKMIAQLKSIGFELWGFTPVFFDDKTGRMMQMDGTFFRS